MAMSINGNGGNGRFRAGVRAKYRPMSEINVTPMVDVMLVLLVIFMITAPLLTVGVPVNLPKTRAAALNEPQEPLVVSVDATGQVFLQESEITLEQLVPRLVAITGAKPDSRIFVRGDKDINYGRVMEVMGTLSVSGFSRVALIAETPKPVPPVKPKIKAKR